MFEGSFARSNWPLRMRSICSIPARVVTPDLNPLAAEHDFGWRPDVAMRLLDHFFEVPFEDRTFTLSRRCSSAFISCTVRCEAASSVTGFRLSGRP